MAYYSPEVIEKAKRIDLLTYLKMFEPNELIKFSRGTYATRSHDSLKISNGMWYWFSRGIGGKSALEYLIQVRKYTFLEALEIIIGQTDLKLPVFSNYNEKRKTDKLVLPPKSLTNDKAKKYLIDRGIDENIVQECIDNDLIYEQKNNGNIVFVGYDKNKNPRYAFIRATNKTRYMHDALGSDKQYSFRLESEEKSNAIHLFESAIDLLSYATLNKNWYKENLISLAGIYQPARDIGSSKIPITIEKYLENNLDISKIILHFDNDSAGRLATISFQKVLSDKYEVIDEPPKIGKDFNDYLCIKNEKITKRKEEKYEKI